MTGSTAAAADAPTPDEADAIPTEDPTAGGGMRTARSLVLVNTGHGKGKSTAAFGTSCEALAQGWPVAVVQFLKSGDWNIGEEKILSQLGVDWLAEGDGFTWDADDLDETQAQPSAPGCGEAANHRSGRASTRRAR